MPLLVILPLHFLRLLHVEEVKLHRKWVVPDEGRCAVREVDLLLVKHEIAHDLFHVRSQV